MARARRSDPLARAGVSRGVLVVEGFCCVGQVLSPGPGCLDHQGAVVRFIDAGLLGAGRHHVHAPILRKPAGGAGAAGDRTTAWVALNRLRNCGTFAIVVSNPGRSCALGSLNPMGWC